MEIWGKPGLSTCEGSGLLRSWGSRWVGLVEFREKNSETKSACVGSGITSVHSVLDHRKPNIQG
jgi:hypothetical protein